jgi:hypothetical protein
MAPLGPLSQAWTSAEASRPLGWRVGGTLTALLLALVACGFDDDEDDACPTPPPLPAGAQEVHIDVTLHGPNGPYSLDLDRYYVPAGDVYLVGGSSINLIERQTGPDATPGPLTFEQQERILFGDGSLENTRLTELDSDDCCDPSAPLKPRQPACGRLLVNLQHGHYLIVQGTPGERDASAAVLAVSRE